MFRCVVGYAGVYDLTLFDGEANRSWSRALRAINHRFVQATVGSDDAVLKRFSPVYNAGKIKAPILLIHGRRDETAPIEHARRLSKALEETGSPEWLEEGDEGHGFCDEGARARMYTRLVAFLREHTSRKN
jgi:dipeptidyl aminopeptidase/acylaminoacyl peptidase